MARRIGEGGQAGAPGLAREVGRGTERERGTGATRAGDERAGSAAPSDQLTISADALRGPLGGGRGAEDDGGAGGDGAAADASGTVQLGSDLEAFRMVAGLRELVLGAPGVAARSHDLMSTSRAAALLRG